MTLLGQPESCLPVAVTVSGEDAARGRNCSVQFTGEEGSTGDLPKNERPSCGNEAGREALLVWT